MVLLPGKWKDPVSCELCIDLLLKKSRRREYKALSYAWGLESRSNPPKIQVDGMLIPITVNLDCALRHIRSPYESVVLWVDALVSRLGVLGKLHSDFKLVHQPG